MWFYSQRSGILSQGTLAGSVCVGKEGYSGRGVARDKPEFEAFHNAGPIPTGRYRIGMATTHPHKGSVVMSLTPLGHNARGRTGFLIHADSIKHPGEASEGCIILDAEQRKKIAQSGDRELVVTQ